MAEQKRSDEMKLGVFLLSAGHHIAAWRHPDAEASSDSDIRHHVEAAQIAERGKLDFLFLADGNLVREFGGHGLGRIAKATGFEPLTLLSALAMVTERIGLVATATTTYNEPYHIARKFASLDQISGGRAGWNVVTSFNEGEAPNFGRDEHLPHEERYARASEFIDVVLGLWNSWEDDAFLRDREGGFFFDPAKMHTLNHRGEHFRVRGPLNVSRSPQGHPVVVQAGSSEVGRALAAASAEVIFTAQQTREGAKAFYADVKSQAAHLGRDPDSIKILPGVLPVVGRSRQEADDKLEQLQSLVHPEVGVALLSYFIGGIDLSPYPIDGPVPELPETNRSRSRQRLILDLARRENLTIRQLYLSVAGARGHWSIKGTASDIADQLEDWFVNRAADGFNISPPILPTGLSDFVDLVVPELQRRGLFRTEYAGRTLRDHLGLARPSHPAAAIRAPVAAE